MLARGVLTVLLSAGAVSAQDRPEPTAGQEIFPTYCWQCHRREGRGSGPMAAMLAIEPPDLTRLAARNGGTFPLAEAAMKIDGRARLLSHGGEMPLFGPSLDSDRTVALHLPDGQPMLTSAPLADLLAYLQTLQVEQHADPCTRSLALRMRGRGWRESLRRS